MSIKHVFVLNVSNPSASVEADDTHWYNCTSTPPGKD